jgi:hypothetical protein
MAEKITERRKFQRIPLTEIAVDVSDGTGFFMGSVYDISRFGLCMKDMPVKLRGDVGQMTVIVAGRGGRFKMNVKPRWSTRDNQKKSIGAEILDAPWGWTEFVMKFEPAANGEVQRGPAS